MNIDCSFYQSCRALLNPTWLYYSTVGIIVTLTDIVMLMLSLPLSCRSYYCYRSCYRYHYCYDYHYRNRPCDCYRIIIIIVKVVMVIVVNIDTVSVTIIDCNTPIQPEDRTEF